MAYNYDKYQGKRSNPLLPILIGIGVLVAAISIFGGVFKPVSPEEKAARMAAQFDEQVAKDKKFGPMFLKLKANFPDDYAAFRSEAVRAYNSGTTEKEAKAIIAMTVRKILHDHADDLLRAPSSNLQDYRKVQLEALTKLQQSSDDICAAYAMHNQQEGVTDDPAIAESGARIMEVLLDAAYAGRQNPTQRSPMTQAESLAFYRALQREGLTETQSAQLTDPEKLKNASHHDQCALVLTVARAVNRLPPDVADKATVAQLKYSIGKI